MEPSTLYKLAIASGFDYFQVLDSHDSNAKPKGATQT